MLHLAVYNMYLKTFMLMMNDKKILFLSQISSFFFLISQGVYTHSKSVSISIHEGVSSSHTINKYSCSATMETNEKW